MIVKLPKKGDLRECTNWRGIMLLPVISKILEVCRQHPEEGTSRLSREQKYH